MQLEKRVQAFISLGKFINQFSSKEYVPNENIPFNDSFFEGLKEQILLAKTHNGWFTEENIHFAFKSWGNALTEGNLNHWISAYQFHKNSPKTIALIMAGNIPLVGFHDFLSVLISGNKVLVKLSSNDKQLLPFLTSYLIAVAPEFKDYISFTEEKLTNFDAIIATGSNNTSRYFEYYFGKYPNIIRKNRNSVAVLTGKETKEQLESLANDIFRYFGMGCRNVSKLYIPVDYDFDNFFNAIYSWKQVVHDNKYMNNYDYNKAVYLMSTESTRGKLLDNEFLLLKEDAGLSSPIAVIFNETYQDLDALKNLLSAEAENIQCIVSESGIDQEIDFGETQNPQLWDYADDVDTMEFLLNLSK